MKTMAERQVAWLSVSHHHSVHGTIWFWTAFIDWKH